jgi:hypothetical protein
MNRHLRIPSILFAFGAFFLPFLAQPLIRARSETGSPNPTRIRVSAKPGEIPKSEKQRRREHAALCESVRGDVALGVF